MINTYDISSKLAIDTRSVDDLRLQAIQDPDNALKEVAKQFEALFVHMMLKTMRDATPKNGMFDSQQTQFYTQMLDQQLAQSMSAKGVGLADMMVQQLTRSSIQPLQSDSTFSTHENMPGGNTPNSNPGTPISGQAGDISGSLWPTNQTNPNKPNQLEQVISHRNEIQAIPQTTANSRSILSNAPKDFVSSVWSHAKIAEQTTGIPAHFMIAQAALESGWGKHEIKHADNSTSFNLFGIKAGKSWDGAVVKVLTTEYINGVPKKMVEEFRAYNSYAESFQDYANLLLNNPRYVNVLQSQDASVFANGLQRAGYATDPMYADKLIRIINSSPIKDQLMI
ncbi:MAG: flagellar assembly peptidoglycan hydrolase FlgJ [Nitrosomonas sp.]|nr:flagellar assembly peptidoglycan hydrolase FlgJ [Nitrosomonas sp.]MDP1950151.1 flagellar assembly peptidoglycan hydrolase FlgJ [Nitrosomonas sp.]